MSTATTRVIIQRQNGETLVDHNLAHGTFGIGRDPENALAANSDYLSRHHATLTLTTDQCWIEDNQSTHGTFEPGIPLSCNRRCECRHCAPDATAAEAEAPAAPPS